MTKFKKNTHLSLSLFLSMHFDFPVRMCMYQSLSLSLSLSLFTFPKNGLDPDQTRMKNQERMFRQFKNLCMRSVQGVVQKAMRAIKWVFSISQ